MRSHKSVEQQPNAAMPVDPEDSNETGIVDAEICECGLPDSCCDHFCSIESCDWMVY